MESSGNGENPFNSEDGLIIRRNEVSKFIKVLKSIHSVNILLSTYNVLGTFLVTGKTVMDTSLANVFGFNSGESREPEEVFLPRQNIEA